jgi:hypothetical protein
LQLDFIKASELREAQQQSEERQRLLQIAEAQAERGAALAQKEEAQKRETEQAKRVVRRTLAGLVVALLLAAIATAAGFIAYQKQQEAQTALARTFSERAWSSVQAGNLDRAVRYAISGWRLAPSNVAHYRAPLARALASELAPTMHPLHQDRVNTLVSTPDGKWIISGGEDGRAVLLESTSLQVAHTLLHDKTPVTASAFDSSGRTVFTISTDGVIRLWDVQSGQKVGELLGHVNRVTDAAFSPDGKRLVSISEDHTARLWDLGTGRSLAVLTGHTDVISAIAISADGRRTATGSADRTVQLWDLATGRLLRRFVKHSDMVTTIAFSSDGRFLATGSRDRIVLLWNISDEKSEPKELVGHDAGIRAISFSEDTTRAYVIDFSGNAYIWDAKAPQILVASSNSAGDAGLASFSRDGRYAIVGAQNGSLTLWDSEAARTLIELRPKGVARATSILWHDNRVVVGDQEGALSVFDLTDLMRSMDDLIARACSRRPAFSPAFSWMEAAADPLIREIWDPKGTERKLCE